MIFYKIIFSLFVNLGCHKNTFKLIFTVKFGLFDLWALLRHFNDLKFQVFFGILYYFAPQLTFGQSFLRLQSHNSVNHSDRVAGNQV